MAAKLEGRRACRWCAEFVLINPRPRAGVAHADTKAGNVVVKPDAVLFTWLKPKAGHRRCRQFHGVKPPILGHPQETPIRAIGGGPLVQLDTRYWSSCKH